MNFADKILYNGTILSMDENRGIYNALAIKDGKIAAVGDKNEILGFKYEGTEFMDLEGKTVLPGFIDSHVHLTQTGLNTLGIDLTKVKSIEEILKLIKRRCETNPEEPFIRGIGYDDENMIEKRPPSIKELDEVIPDKPVFLFRIDSHSMTVNSKALDILNLPEKLEGIDLDRYGKPTGVLRAGANSLGRSRAFDLIDDSIRLLALQMAAQLALKKGVTTVNALEGGKLFNDRDVEVILKHKNELPIDVEVFYQTTDVDKVLSLGLKRIGGCIILDGSFGSRTAALLEPYSDDSSTNGVLYYTQKEIDEFVEKAHRAGLQTTVHALGDRAIDQIMSAYERAMHIYPRKDSRHRIEHVELPNKRQIEQAAKLGIILSVQPAFEYYWGGLEGMYGTRLGRERTLMTNPYKTMINSGCMLVGGSDSDVTPIDPLLGVHGAVNHSNIDERIDVLRALEMFTINGAKAIFMEDRKGSIAKGKDADLVILKENPLDVEAKKIKDIKVEMTIKSGEIVYR